MKSILNLIGEHSVNSDVFRSNFPAGQITKENIKKYIENIEKEEYDPAHLRPDFGETGTTINISRIKTCGWIFGQVVDRLAGFNDLKILDIGAGTCIGTCGFIKESGRQIDVKCTDLINSKSDSLKLDYYKLDHLSAVERFKEWANVLLMISPPPFDESNPLAYGDIYAVDEFIKTADRPKLIVFVGEMGLSDGTTGFDDYMKQQETAGRINNIMKKSIRYELKFDLNKELFIYIINPAGQVDKYYSCDYCRKVNTNLSRCSRCLYSYYCNSDCQRADYKEHKIMCFSIFNKNK